jgi:hypothetical protein
MTRPIAILCSLLATVPACTGTGDDDMLELAEGDYTKGGSFGKADASVEAVIVDMEFDGSVLASSSLAAQSTIDAQLLYTIGHLNHDKSVGRLDIADIEITGTQSAGNGLTRVSYHVRLPVAWGKKNAVPQTYELRLPLDATFSGQETFTSNYSTRCVDFGAHDVEAGNMWYYYRPRRSGCSLDESHIVRTTATVTVSDVNTTGKYPEYDKVWEDDVLQVVAVFGKYEDGATTSSDAGISAYNRFHRAIQQELAPFGVAVEPANLGTAPTRPSSPTASRSRSTRCSSTTSAPRVPRSMPAMPSCRPVRTSSPTTATRASAPTSVPSRARASGCRASTSSCSRTAATPTRTSTPRCGTPTRT